MKKGDEDLVIKPSFEGTGRYRVRPRAIESKEYLKIGALET